MIKTEEGFYSCRLRTLSTPTWTSGWTTFTLPATTPSSDGRRLTSAASRSASWLPSSPLWWPSSSSSSSPFAQWSLKAPHRHSRCCLSSFLSLRSVRCSLKLARHPNRVGKWWSSELLVPPRGFFLARCNIFDFQRECKLCIKFDQTVNPAKSFSSNCCDCFSWLHNKVLN